ncbi:hypothetical protein WDU94_014798 [Cyamophila willieti]
MFRQCASLDGTGLKDPRTHEVAKITALLHLGRMHGDKKRYAEAVVVYREALHRMPPYYQPSVSGIKIIKKIWCEHHTTFYYLCYEVSKVYLRI